MTKGELGTRLMRVARGVIIASAITLIAIAALAALVIYAGLKEEWLMTLNQVVKVASIVLGVLAAVGVGGDKGLITGMIVGMVYILAGYGFYSLVEGSGTPPAVMALEEAIGAVAGGVSGVVFANLRPMRRSA